MSDHVYKSVEITGSSSKGVTEAIETAVGKASQTLRNLDWFEVAEVRGYVSEGAIDHFQVRLKIGFRLDEEGAGS
jgi:dodecin